MSTIHEEMSFLDHLEELRWRVIKSIASVAICAIPCGIYWRYIFDLVMIYPLRYAEPKPQLIFTAPAEAVVLSIKIALFGGILLSAPVIFYQVWRFIAPGLHKHEKKTILPAAFFSTLFFLGGVALSYVMIPHVLRFLSQFAAGRMEPFFRTNEYLSFLIKLSLAFGVVFELPIISFVFTKLGFLTPGLLWKKFKYALVIVFILAALLTPPDIISQIFLALPLLVLYGISIIVSFFAQERKKA
ncbi:MAG: twin-arginine translocase subunit TatC [Fibrobacterota bacterium]